MKQQLRSQDAKDRAAQLRTFVRTRLDEVSVDRRMIDAIALAGLLADGEDDIAEGRTRSFRLFFKEFQEKIVNTQSNRRRALRLRAGRVPRR
jgi:hypothetical protein